MWILRNQVTIPLFFVKASNSSNPKKVEKKKVVYNHQNKKANVYKRKQIPRYKSKFVPNCFYCGIIGHTPNACLNMAFVSQVEPTKVAQALEDDQ